MLNRVEKDKKEYYKEIFSDKKLEFCNYSNDEEHVSVNDLVLTEEYNKLLPINTPIISVAGMGNKTDKYFIQLYLKKYFKERNYKLDLVSTKHYGGILGDIPMPSFLFSENIFETNKVFLFNRFIKIIEQKNNPDLIILGIPNSVLPLNNDNSDGFGIIPFLIFQAVKPDYSILSLYYDDYTKKYYEEIDLLMKYRFGSEIDCFNISNTRLDWMNLENETTRYLSINNFSNAIDVINKMKKYNYKNIININRFNFNEIGFYIETQLKKHANINIF